MIDLSRTMPGTMDGTTEGTRPRGLGVLGMSERAQVFTA